jgi:hypothetical protein
VAKKTTKAQATVVFRLSVGGRKPGTKPRRLEKRMKKPKVPIKGRNFRPRGPIMSSKNFKIISVKSSKRFRRVSRLEGTMAVGISKATFRKAR